MLFGANFEVHPTQEKQDHGHNRQHERWLPEIADADALEHDALEHVDEVSCGNNRGNVLQREWHTINREDEPR